MQNVRRGRRINRGGEADIYSAIHQGHPVVIREIFLPDRTNLEDGEGADRIKQVRELYTSEAKYSYATQRIRREVLTHCHLRHPNIIELLGVTYDEDHPLLIVMPSMPNGNARAYLAAHQEEFLKIVSDISHWELGSKDQRIYRRSLERLKV